MIKLTKNTINRVWVTFTESMNNTSNWIYIVFTNENNPNFKYHLVLKDNLSLNQNRTDLFNIKLTDDESEIDPENAVISLPLAGFYEYVAYELDSSVNFDPEDPAIIKTVELGRCQVLGDSPSVHSVYK